MTVVETDAAPVGRIGKFEVESWWSNVDAIAEARANRWWWVYVISDVDFMTDPLYVGFAHNLGRRLTEHGRWWREGRGYVTAIAMPREASARRLELALISLLEPTSNVVRPTLTWIESEWFGGLQNRWTEGDISICSGCGCLLAEMTYAPGPVTEPDDQCVTHYGEGRLRQGVVLIGAIVAMLGLPTRIIPTSDGVPLSELLA